MNLDIVPRKEVECQTTSKNEQTGLSEINDSGVGIIETFGYNLIDLIEQVLQLLDHLQLLNQWYNKN